MKMKALFRLSIALCSSFLLLAGCTSPGKNMIPQGGSMTMSQIYKEETTGGYLPSPAEQNTENSGNQKQIRNYLRSDDQNNINYLGLDKHKFNSEFKTLPDPEVPMYVYPHFVRLNGESYPKPGMMTAFFLYRRNHFALPSEVY